MSQKLKNSLTIKLTEPVVYLKDVDFTGRRRTHNETAPPSMLRGLLVLTLVKPTRISSIEIELQGRSSITMPEGIGARRVDILQEHQIMSANTIYFRAGSSPNIPRRAISVDPGVNHYRNEQHSDDESSPDSEPEDEPAPRGRGRHARRASADHSILQREFVSHEQSFHLPDPSLTSESSTPALSPAPSIVNLRSASASASHTPTVHRTPPAVTPISRQSTLPETPGQALQDFRRVLRSELNTPPSSSSSSQRGRPTTQTAGSSGTASPAPDYFAPHVNFAAESRRTSIDDSSRSRDLTPSDSRLTSPVRQASHDDARGHNKRFSLTTVSNALLDRMRSESPRSARSKEREGAPRGRSTDKGKAKDTLTKVSEALGLDAEERKESGAGWHEFKKGTYTYPISFAIPADSPPSLGLEYGSVLWRLKATVHRPGTFTSKITHSREVVVVASPSEDDIEDTESIVVERMWEDQMQYLLVISGRSFSIGGSIPVQITFMPLSKIKVYRITVMLEEKVTYYTQMKRVARAVPPTRLTLVTARYADVPQRPILPLPIDELDVFENSPLYHALIHTDGSSITDHPRSDLSEYTSELASELMGPGPWKLQFDAKIPPASGSLHPTNSNKKSNIIVGHLLKIAIRVERGDDQELDENGKRKLFDIVIQTPVHLLSRLCNLEYMSLPRYSESCSAAAALSCGSTDHTHMLPEWTGLNHPGSRGSNEVAGSSQVAESHSTLRHPDDDEALQYERLVTGQETSMGEAPPSYYAATVVGT